MVVLKIKDIETTKTEMYTARISIVRTPTLTSTSLNET